MPTPELTQKYNYLVSRYGVYFPSTDSRNDFLRDIEELVSIARKEAINQVLEIHSELKKKDGGQSYG